MIIEKFKDDIYCLVQLNLNLVEIEKVLTLCYGHVRGLSYRSLRRFCKKENLKVKCTDAELNVMVSEKSTTLQLNST
jgi:hypothetical protein